MSLTYDCADPLEREAGIRVAVAALQRGELAVLPTDTVYGIAADAFSPAAVAALLAAKGRGRDMPVPVLVAAVDGMHALASGVPDAARRLAAAFWPGALTIVLRHHPHLAWDLGETRGTVAVRMPDHEIALEVIRETGPLAVSSANRSGAPPATTAAEAEAQLGATVEVYLEAGPAPGGQPSTIVDATGPVLRLLRTGALSLEQLREVVPEVSGTP